METIWNPFGVDATYILLPSRRLPFRENIVFYLKDAKIRIITLDSYPYNGTAITFCSRAFG